MRRAASWICLTAGALALVVAALIWAMDMTATDSGRYMAIHETLNTQTGLDEEGVRRADRALAVYLRGRDGEDDDLDYEDSVYGETTRVFNDREIEHMRDVRGIFETARKIEMWAIIAGVLLMVAGICLYNRASASRALKSVNIAVSVIAVAAASGVYLITRDFSRAFLAMHSLLFDNDLWVLNPETDLMIRLLPEQFFQSMARQMAVSAIWMLVAVAAASTAGILVIKKRN
ncbi:MAG: TIGR01906 family membrane protein, partial [Clostridia bacterium]|nr:TIGR01906 family membrane protein [Clostridia bacterium]